MIATGQKRGCQGGGEGAKGVWTAERGRGYSRRGGPNEPAAIGAVTRLGPAWRGEKRESCTLAPAPVRLGSAALPPRLAGGCAFSSSSSSSSSVSGEAAAAGAVGAHAPALRRSG